MNGAKKILIVDDDRNLVEAIKVTLLSRDYNVFTAYDGEEGIKKAKEIRPDLIILDVMMDKKHGYDVCSELKKNPEFSSIPVMMLTGVGQHLHESQWTHWQGLTLEAEDFIEKPIEPRELLKRIEEFLGG
ncbi:MAG: response regulator [Pseudomonadota bacterium]